MTSLSIEIDW